MELPGQSTHGLFLGNQIRSDATPRWSVLLPLGGRRSLGQVSLHVLEAPSTLTMYRLPMSLLRGLHRPPWDYQLMRYVGPHSTRASAELAADPARRRTHQTGHDSGLMSYPAQRRRASLESARQAPIDSMVLQSATRSRSNPSWSSMLSTAEAQTGHHGSRVDQVAGRPSRSGGRRCGIEIRRDCTRDFAFCNAGTVGIARRT
jgi:hypothetical protein